MDVTKFLRFIFRFGQTISYYFQSGPHDHAVFIFNDNAIEGFVEFYHNNRPLLPFNHSYDSYGDVKNWIATGIYQYGFYSCGSKCTILRRYQATL